MANRILTQTDSVAGCGTVIGCSGGTIALVPQAREATKDGTPGVGELEVEIYRLATEAGVMFQSANNEPGKTTWEAGDWVVRLNVTTVQEYINWVAAYVCRFDNACGSLAVVGSLTGQSISLGTVGVKQMTVAGAEQAANLSDEIYIVLLFTSTSSHVDKVFGFIPDQNIDTPIVEATEFVYSGDVPLSALPDTPKGLLDMLYSGDVPLTALPDAPIAALEKSYAGAVGLALVPNSIYELVVEYLYAGDITTVILPSYTSILDRLYAGNIPLGLMPTSTRILDRIYSGDIPLVAMPNFPEAILEKSYAGDVTLIALPNAPVAPLEKSYSGAIGLVLLPNSIYELAEGEANEFVYAGDIPLIALPSYASIVDRVYQGAVGLNILPDFSKALLAKAYAGAVTLVLTPNSGYLLESPATEFLYTGNILVSLLPDYSLALEKAYSGDINIVAVPTSLYSGIRAALDSYPSGMPIREVQELILIGDKKELVLIGSKKPVFISEDME